MQSVPLQKNISTATNNSTFSNSPKGGVSLPAVPVYQQKPIQKMELEEEQPVQAKFATQLKVDITAAPPPSENSDNNNDGTAQLKELEEEMPLQGKFIVQKKELEDELSMQGKFIAQRMELEEEPPIQGKFILQRKEREEQVPIQPKFKIPSSAPTEPKTFQRFVLQKSNEPEAVQTPIQMFVLPTQPIQKKANNTGLPDNLKAGVENLSGFSMDDVKVHYYSAKPAQLQAHAYAQGTDIHIGPGQEKHLPHEAWHVVQQKQGRVQATMQMKGGVGVNNDKGLEGEADLMGAKALNRFDQHKLSFEVPTVSQQEVYQLVNATQLVCIGKQWNNEIWIKGDLTRKTELIASIQQLTGFSSGTVFQDYDLFIRGKGPGAYKDIVKQLDTQCAQKFHDFLNDKIEFANLPDELSKLALIVCVSETGRGYNIDEMIKFMKSIIEGITTWANINDHYFPSLTYTQDAIAPNGLYVNNDESSDSEDDGESLEIEDDISDGESNEMKVSSENNSSINGTRSGTNFKILD